MATNHIQYFVNIFSLFHKQKCFQPPISIIDLPQIKTYIENLKYWFLFSSSLLFLSEVQGAKKSEGGFHWKGFLKVCINPGY